MGQHEEIAREWFSAFNEKDLDRLLGLYHDKATHYSPKLKARQPDTNGLVQGKPALRDWWQDAFHRLPSLHYRPTTITANNERVFLEYIRTVNGEPNMLVAEVLEIGGGLILASRVYHG
jgi:hypothetical protein